MRKSQEFNAQCVSCYIENDVLIAAVGDDDQEPDNFFIISRLDEVDWEINSCISLQTESIDNITADSIQSVYCDVSQITLELADDEGNEYIIMAALPDGCDVGELRSFIKQIFEGSTVKLEIK